MKNRSQLNKITRRYLLLTFFFFFCIRCFYTTQIFKDLSTFSSPMLYYRPKTPSPFSCPVNLSTTPSAVSCYLLLLWHFGCTFGPLYLRVAHWSIKSSTDGKYSEGVGGQGNSKKFQKANREFVPCRRLFTKHWHCSRYYN